MELREIVSLTRLASNGSIQKTASQCNLTPGAVHRHLKALEGEFGARLYEKIDGRLQLTEAGEIILPFLREILSQQEGARQALADWNRSPHGVVRIGAGPAFTSRLLPVLLSTFRRAYPEVEFYLETGRGTRLVQALLEGTLDLAFEVGSAASHEPRLKEVATWDAPLGFVAGQTDVPVRCQAEELERFPFVLFERGSYMDRVAQVHLGGCGVHPKIVMRSDNAEAIKSMIRQGLGIGMVFLWTVQEELRSGLLRQVSVVGHAPPVSRMSLLTKRTRYLPKAVTAFIETVRSTRWEYLNPRRSGPRTPMMRKRRTQ